MQIDIKTYLVLKFGNPILLENVVQTYYPNINKMTMNKKANNQDFEFPVFKLDNSPKAPFLVDASALAECIERKIKDASNDHYHMHF